MKLFITIIVTLVVVGILLYLFTPRRATTSQSEPVITEEEFDRQYEAKEAALERILGPIHDLVGHAMIPFEAGGGVDMYYFPNGIEGTGFATMEVIAADGSGPKPNRIGTYELVAFTKHEIKVKKYAILYRGSDDMPESEDESKPLGPYEKIERRMNLILTIVGHYGYEAVLNPGDTSEVPGLEGEPNMCLIFDEYSPDGIPFEIDGKRHCLLLCIEIFRSEMEYAMEHGSAVVLQKLKESGRYPYSDLDRKPVY